MTPDEKNQLLLTQLILMFQTAALQHMGKLKNPITDKIERDLQQAQISIDILEMLKLKMRGNLGSDEERILTDVLRELKLNYVDEVSRDQASTEKPQADSAGSEPPSPT